MTEEITTEQILEYKKMKKDELIEIIIAKNHQIQNLEKWNNILLLQATKYIQQQIKD
jgi:hypothetical protein